MHQTSSVVVYVSPMRACGPLAGTEQHDWVFWRRVQHRVPKTLDPLLAGHPRGECRYRRRIRLAM
jgi:hypothetical protein